MHVLHGNCVMQPLKSFMRFSAARRSPTVGSFGLRVLLASMPDSRAKLQRSSCGCWRAAQRKSDSENPRPMRKWVLRSTILRMLAASQMQDKSNSCSSQMQSKLLRPTVESVVQMPLARSIASQPHKSMKKNGRQKLGSDNVLPQAES